MLNTAQFTWNPASKTFSCEASDFLGKDFPLEPAYPDACDIGFTLVSARTGEEVKMVQTGTSRDNEGDIMYWTFQPVSRVLRNLFKVVIFND